MEQSDVSSNNEKIREKDILALLILMEQGVIENQKLLGELEIRSADLEDPKSAERYRRALEEKGVIESYPAKINWKKVGYPTEFVIVTTAGKRDILLEIERECEAAVEGGEEQNRSNMLVISLGKEDKVILKDVIISGESPAAIISGIATDDGAAMIYANFYLPKKFPGVDTNLLIVNRSAIKDFDFQDKFIESIIPFLFDDEADIEKYMEKYEKEFMRIAFKDNEK